MSNEEFQRKMDFIVEQQALFASDMQVLRESQTQLQATQVQTEQVLARLACVTKEGFKDVIAKMDALVDSQIRTDASLKGVDAKIVALVDSQVRLTEAQAKTDQNAARTEERLRNLIDTVERHITEGRNGH